MLASFPSDRRQEFGGSSCDQFLDSLALWFYSWAAAVLHKWPGPVLFLFNYRAHRWRPRAVAQRYLWERSRTQPEGISTPAIFSLISATTISRSSVRRRTWDFHWTFPYPTGRPRQPWRCLTSCSGQFRQVRSSRPMCSSKTAISISRRRKP